MSTWQCLSSGSKQNPSSTFPSPFTQWRMSNSWFPGRKPTWWFCMWSWGRSVPWLMKLSGASSWVPLPFFTLHSWSVQVCSSLTLNSQLFFSTSCLTTFPLSSISHLIFQRTLPLKCYSFPLHCFPVAAVANRYRLGDLTQCVPLCSRGQMSGISLTGPKSRCQQVCVSSGVSKEESVLASFSFWWLLVFLAWDYITPSPAPAVTLPPPLHSRSNLPFLS